MEDRDTCKRIRYVDVAKGIGMMIVVLGHTIEPYSMLWKFIFTFHMPLFFFMSGYTMGESRYFSLRKRFIKLMPSYFISAFILCFFHPIVMAVFKHEKAMAYLSIEHLFNAIGSTFFGTGMGVAYVPNIMTVGALWFIPCMMLVSVIVDFFIIRIKKDYIKGVLSGILLVAGLIIGKIIILPWSFDLALAGHFFYMVGVWLKKWSEKMGGYYSKFFFWLCCMWQGAYQVHLA